MRISLVLNHSPEVCKFSSFMSTMEGWVFCVKIICPSAKTHSIQKRHLFPSETGLGLLVMRFWIPLLDKHCRPAEVQAECERNLERANLEEGDVDYQCHLGTTCDRRHWACSTNPPVLSLEEIALSTAHGRPSAISRTKQSQDGAKIVMGITGVKNGRSQVPLIYAPPPVIRLSLHSLHPLLQHQLHTGVSFQYLVFLAFAPGLP